MVLDYGNAEAIICVVTLHRKFCEIIYNYLSQSRLSDSDSNLTLGKCAEPPIYPKGTALTNAPYEDRTCPNVSASLNRM